MTFVTVLHEIFNFKRGLYSLQASTSIPWLSPASVFYISRALYRYLECILVTI
jgi:hypothetical protein